MSSELTILQRDSAWLELPTDENGGAFLPATLTSQLSQLSAAAEEWATGETLRQYREERAANTLQKHDDAIARFMAFLTDAGIDVDQLRGNDGRWLMADHLEAWGWLDHHVLFAFRQWLLNEGMAIGTINATLSSLRTYAGLASQAGHVSAGVLTLIHGVNGFGRKAGVRRDEKRDKTRVGNKKAEARLLDQDQANELMRPGISQQERRDCMLMTLLLMHGLRAGEAAILRTKQLSANEMTFHRPKVLGTDYETGTHILTKEAKAALQDWSLYAGDPLLLRASRKGGKLLDSGMGERAITKRVRALGKERLGIEDLSAHDCRHFCATNMAARGYSIIELMAWFGWTSPATAIRYVKAAEKAERYKG